MRGTRVADGMFEGSAVFVAGNYGRVEVKPGEWEWRGVAPNGMLANLVAHTVTEHDDGTITVEPSILVSDGNGKSWHGYLDEGAWRSC